MPARIPMTGRQRTALLALPDTETKRAVLIRRSTMRRSLSIISISMSRARKRIWSTA